MALALLVLLLDLDALQDVPGVRLIGDDADLTLASCLLDKASGGLIQLDLVTRSSVALVTREISEVARIAATGW